MEIVSGRSKSGKTKYIYDKIASLAKSGQQAMLIVPEQFTHGAERHLLELVDTIGENGVEVFSFEHLATATQARIGCPHAQKINPVAKSLIIKNILADGKFEFYKNAGQQKGFTDIVASSMAELKKYMIMPDTLLQLANDSDNKVLSMKLRDLSNIYRMYEEELSEYYEDTDEPLTILAKQLTNAPLYSEKHIFLDEFDTFVPQELEVIRALSASCKSFTIALCGDEKECNTTLFMPTSDTFARLTKTLNSAPKITKLTETYFASRELSHLEKNLFAFKSAPYGKTAKDIEIYALSNPLSEVENCAYTIKKLVSDYGYRYSDIGVVCSDIGMYKMHLERVFDYADIEYFIDEKDDVLNHHLVRFILGLLEIYIEDYSYNSVFNYLKTSFVNANPSHIALLERFIQNTGIRRLTWLDDERWNALVDANYKEDVISARILSDIRNKYILPLANMHEKLKGKNTVRHDATVLFDYILQLEMPKIISNYIEKFEAEGELHLAKEYEKIWQVILEALDETVHINSDKKISPKSFYDMLVTAFSQQKVGSIPSAIDCVMVGNTERTRFEDIKVLYVLGVNESVFPMSLKPDGVLNDSDKLEMKDQGVEFSTTSSVAAYYFQYASYRTFTMPSEKLYISYSKCGNDSKTLRKSYIIDRILKMFGIKEKLERDFSDISSLYAKGPAREMLCKNIAAFESGRDISGDWKNLYDYLNRDEEFTTRLERFMDTHNFAEQISSTNLKKLIPMLSYTSVSKLERYMACKYAYFIDYVLNIDRPKTETVDALDIGNITHKVLEVISRKYASDIKTLSGCSESDVLGLIDAEIDKYICELSKHSDEISARDRYAVKRLKNSIWLCFSAVKSQLLNSKFEPLGYEIEFSEKSELGPIHLTTADGADVKLTGKIDRADIYIDGDNSYIRVIDYKTGKKELKLDDVFYGLNMQLMVYLSKLVGIETNNKHGGALYFSVSDISVKSDVKMMPEEAQKAIEASLGLKGLVPYDEAVLDAYDKKMASSVKRANTSGNGVSLDGFKTIDSYLKKKLGEICTDMFRGDFSILPYKKGDFSPCDYCGYSSVCRFDPSCRDEKYRFYKSVSANAQIIKEMEEEINVDTSTRDCD